MKIKAKCDFCGKVIYKSEYQIKTNKNHFCNKKCKGKWKSKYVINYQKIQINRKVHELEKLGIIKEEFKF